MKTQRICLGWPWYSGPDVDAYTNHFEVVHYFGRLQERSYWMSKGCNPEGLPDLDPMHADGQNAEITAADGKFDFFYADETRLSLPGLARERLAETALRMDCDWLFMWDYDMLMAWSCFLRLWRHQKPVIAALAFTAREPYHPVIYRIREQAADGGIRFNSERVFDYPRNQLITSADIGGSLAFGTGTVLINTSVFRQLPKPWFHSTGCGEDFYFCVQCHKMNIPRYVDTSTKVLHKEHKARWVGEQAYDRMRQQRPDEYLRMSAQDNGKPTQPLAVDLMTTQDLLARV